MSRTTSNAHDEAITNGRESNISSQTKETILPKNHARCDLPVCIRTMQFDIQLCKAPVPQGKIYALTLTNIYVARHIRTYCQSLIGYINAFCNSHQLNEVAHEKHLLDVTDWIFVVSLVLNCARK